VQHYSAKLFLKTQNWTKIIMFKPRPFQPAAGTGKTTPDAAMPPPATDSIDEVVDVAWLDPAYMGIATEYAQPLAERFGPVVEDANVPISEWRPEPPRKMAARAKPASKDRDFCALMDIRALAGFLGGRPDAAPACAGGSEEGPCCAPDRDFRCAGNGSLPTPAALSGLLQTPLAEG
jgi:hypothetical protein